MSKEPNPLNDSSGRNDANDLSRSELIEENNLLKEEIERLKLNMDEYETLLQKKPSSEQEIFKGSEDIQILKEMIISQREALNHKDDEIDCLKEKNALLDEYKGEIEKLRVNKSHLSDALASIDTLTNELNMYKANEENAKELIIRLTEEKKIFEENEEETLRLIGELSEKKEKYKSKVKQLENTLKNGVQGSVDDIKQQSVEKPGESQENYEKKIKKLEKQLEFVKISAIEEVSEFDDEKESIASDYEYKIQNLESKIRNMEKSFKEIKTTLETENNKYKNRIIELQKQMQKLPKTIDEDPVKPKNLIEIHNKNSLKAELGGNQERDTSISIKSISTSMDRVESDLEDLSPKKGVVVEEESKIMDEPFIDSIRKCPKCGNQKKNLMREELDKTNIIMAYPRMYGKKYVCGAFGCGCNWRIKNDTIEIL